MIRLLTMRISRTPPCPVRVHTDPRIASACSEGFFRLGSSLPGSVAIGAEPTYSNRAVERFILSMRRGLVRSFGPLQRAQTCTIGLVSTVDWLRSDARTNTLYPAAK